MSARNFVALYLLATAAAVSLAQTPASRWEPEIDAFEAADKTHPPPKDAILFLGSSSIRLWKTLAKDFPDYPVINRGFGGSEIGDSVYFAGRIVLPYQPKQIVLYAGGNDLNTGKSPEQVLANFRAFVNKVHTALPHTQISYLSIAPSPARWAQVEKIKAANQLIADYCTGKPELAFINVFSHMLGNDSRPRPEIFSDDHLHLNAEGYALWTKLVRPHLK